MFFLSGMFLIVFIVISPMWLTGALMAWSKGKEKLSVFFLLFPPAAIWYFFCNVGRKGRTNDA